MQLILLIMYAQELIGYHIVSCCDHLCNAANKQHNFLKQARSAFKSAIARHLRHLRLQLAGGKRAHGLQAVGVDLVPRPLQPAAKQRVDAKNFYIMYAALQSRARAKASSM